MFPACGRMVPFIRRVNLTPSCERKKRAVFSLLLGLTNPEHKRGDRKAPRKCCPVASALPSPRLRLRVSEQTAPANSSCFAPRVSWFTNHRDSMHFPAIAQKVPVKTHMSGRNMPKLPRGFDESPHLAEGYGTCSARNIRRECRSRRMFRAEHRTLPPRPCVWAPLRDTFRLPPIHPFTRNVMDKNASVEASMLF